MANGTLSLNKEYNKKHHVQIAVVHSEFSELNSVYNLGAKVGEFVIAPIGAFYNDLHAGLVGSVACGICDSYEIKDRFKVITKAQAEKYALDILKRVDAAAALEEENRRLQEEISALKKKGNKQGE